MKPGNLHQLKGRCDRSCNRYGIYDHYVRSYRVLAASLALAIYTTLVIATLYLFEITLTLPGIAGIILGIGMAVDANVIVFARVREEIATGKSVQTCYEDRFPESDVSYLRW